jgi:hypothetical protein
MKNTILLLIWGLSLTAYSQDIEKMDKKELRIALKNSNASKDSLYSINSDKDKKMALLNQNLILYKDSIKIQKGTIASILSLKKQSDERSKLLTDENKIFKDSIDKLKSSFPFINTAINFEQGTSVQDGCSCSFAESKLKYDKGETLYISDLGDNCTISINNKNINLKNSTPNIIEEAKYSNNEYSVYVHKKKVIKSKDQQETSWFNAEMVIENKKTGNKIIKNIYGSCGC